MVKGKKVKDGCETIDTKMTPDLAAGNLEDYFMLKTTGKLVRALPAIPTAKYWDAAPMTGAI